MIAILFSWVIIFFILFSFGDILLKIFNKLTRREEQYNSLDKNILGLIALSIPLSVWSLFLPSNHVFLIICIVISLINVITDWRRWKRSGKVLINKVKNTPKKTIGFIALFSVLILISCSWIEGLGDPLYYHYQNIRWNEEYAIVPGLGNLDDKFAFNSQYLLLSSIFTFRHLFHQALYPLIPLFVIYVMAWLLIELYKSGYELKRLIITISYIVFIVISLNSVFDTSTDLLPNILAFYIAARIIFTPCILDNKRLLYFSLPLFLIVCKISMLPFCFLSLYILVLFIKEKKCKYLLHYCILAFLIVTPWLIRNVILSGYLVYPLYQIDLFNFDWKLPKDVAVKATEYIKFVPTEYLNFLITMPEYRYRSHFYINVIVLFIYFFSIVSIPAICIFIIRRIKQIPISYILLFVILVSTIVIWLLNGPDIRFIAGVCCIAISFASILLLQNKNKLKLHNTGLLVLSIFLLYLSAWTIRRCQYNYQTVTEGSSEYVHRPYSSVVYKPYTREELSYILNPDFDSLFEPYTLNNGIVIYISYADVTLERLPATVHQHRGKFVDYRCLEARGMSVQDGFRIK